MNQSTSKIKETRKRVFGSEEPFSTWIRTSHQEKLGSHTFSCQDIDYVWHNYRENWLMMIELKTHGGPVDESRALAQEDTHGVVHQMLKHSNGIDVDTLRGRRKATYKGRIRLTFENTTPEDSEWIKVNETKVTEEQLVHILEHGKWPEDVLVSVAPAEYK